MLEHHKIDYVQFPSADLDRTKAFFVAAFGWELEDLALTTPPFPVPG